MTQQNTPTERVLAVQRDDLQQADIYDSDLVMKLLALILEGLKALFSTAKQLRLLAQKLDQS